MSVTQIAPAIAPQSAAPARPYNYAIGYLKAMTVAGVVAHHAVLAYHPSAPPPPESLLAVPRIWQAFPVVDQHGGSWASLLPTFNDIFFMALMFFLSGLFVWKSLVRKGAGPYLRDRVLRLGLPFIPVALIIAPLSYYPTYLQLRQHGGFGDYLRVWASLGTWSAGPVWFLWVLLVFDLLAVLLFLAAPRWGDALGRLTAGAAARPVLFFLALVVAGDIAYSAMTLAFGPFRWFAWGPFTFHACRILLYFVYFVAGIAVGAQGLDSGLLSANGKLARRWRLWLALTLVAFIAYIASVMYVFSHPLPMSWHAALANGPVMGSMALFALSCAASGFAFMAFFLRYANSRIRVLDNLSKNAFGIFLIHFVFVSWCCYALLGAALPPFAKFVLASAGALALSWGTTALLRRIPGAHRIL